MKNDERNKIIESAEPQQGFLELFTKFELSISEGVDDLTTEQLSTAKGNLKALFVCILKENDMKWRSYSKLLESLHSLPKDHTRKIVLLIIRSLVVRGLIPLEEPHLEAKIVQATSTYLVDFAKAFGLDNKKQGYENFNAISSIHQTILVELTPWSKSPATIDGVCSNKQKIFKSAKKSFVHSYLAHYDLTSVLLTVTQIYSLIEKVNDDDNDDFNSAVEELQEVINAQQEYIRSNANFFTLEIYKPLITSINIALSAATNDASERFDCDLKPKIEKNTFLADKKYPLHEVDREITIRIPMINTGPGRAIDISVVYSEEDDALVALDQFEQQLGNQRPGHFELAVKAIILEAVNEFEFCFKISWKIQGSTFKKEKSFICKLEAQKPDINWEELTNEGAYGTDAAEEDEFVGRTEKLNALVNRALLKKPQSSYISGQKRIGKTSLAKQVLHCIGKDHGDRNIETHYIEWGDVANEDPSQSVVELGESIEIFLSEFLPTEDKPLNLNFNGSIAPLNRLADLLFKKTPERKFLIVIDEFDLIPVEMYRQGNLAMTFFANLRSLSSKPNIAFMLVGGENMSFVINAQGDQLNRFVSESLDYFSKETEGDDYTTLVEQPTEKNLNWHKDAIKELFYLTNGHPYYTKLICANVFLAAVKNRDSEIGVREIDSAVVRLVDKIDTNSFMHHWKDGIQTSDAETETTILNRRRCLVAMGRCLRNETALNTESVYKENSSSKPTLLEVKVILIDFARRQIIKEDASNNFEFTVPFFKKWLESSGIRSLMIMDDLGDKLAVAREASDEKLKVSTNEIENLVEPWELYRGRDVTTEKVRMWIDQVESAEEKRLLFTLLENLKFVTEGQIREKLKIAHDKVKATLPLGEIIKSKKQKRRDIVVCYIDGQAKSGQDLAAKYVRENSVPTKNVISSKLFSEGIAKIEIDQDVTINGIVLIDDIVGTGKSFSSNFEKFINENFKFIVQRSIRVSIVVLISTEAGAKAIDKVIDKFKDLEITFMPMEMLDPKHYAFSENKEIWKDDHDFEMAQALCNRIGSYIQKKDPLGYDGQGLLITFADRCPNNSLPILHGSSDGDVKWKPLFERPKN